MLPFYVDKREEKPMSTGEKIKSHINRFMRSHIGDLIGEVRRYFWFIIFVWIFSCHFSTFSTFLGS